ncbi:MAG TPA: lamin tail domain-containing protein [Verrucomicrobiae bacterium]
MMVFIFLLANDPVRAQLPSGWTDTDIGSPGLAGSASYASGVWTVTGSGSDIWNNADQFNFASTNFTGDGTMIVLVTSIQNSDPGSGWSKAGLMFRNDSTAGSANVSIVATAGQGVSFQWRSTADGSCSFNNDGGVTAPVWLKLVRSGANFTGYYSQDGINWVQVGTSQVGMNPSVMAGMDVTSHNNSALNTTTFTNFSLAGTPPPIFGVYRQRWSNLDSSPGNTLMELTNTTYNPNWPANPDPAYTQISPGFETEVNDGVNNWGERLRAFVVPPTNGDYTFWIASDDTSDLFISTDETPANKTIIASVISWTSWQDFSSEPTQQSSPVYLQGGQRYYIEALMQQGGGDDNLTVQWQLPDGTIELPLATGSADGTLLVPFTGLTNMPGIYFQPATNTIGLESGTATFFLLATNPAPLRYQWRLSGTNLPGASSPVLVLSNLNLSWTGESFVCIVSNVAGSVTSAPAILTVLADTNPPAILNVVGLGITNVQVTYSKVVEAASATNTANYIFTNGLAVTGAALNADNQTVVLTTAPLTYGSNYCVVVNRVRDRAATPNTIATNTTMTFPAFPYAPLDLGNASVASTVTAAGNGFNVTAAGADFGGNSDQGNFSYQLVTGNFDVAVRVAGLSLSDIFAKAGLMARESLTAGSRFAAAFTTPAMNGSFFEWRDPSANAASTTGNFPANYPNTWLRLQRTGNTFNGFASYDGQVWTPLGSATISMPGQIYLGFSVSSRSASAVATAQFRDITTVTNAVAGVVANPHDAMGPSSRKTPVAFSEIMYKPAPRTDGKNLEFVEIYNSNPWFQDISGYQITCADMNYTFPANTQIPGGGYLVIAAAPADIQSVYGITNVMGPYTGSLKKTETLELLDEQGALLLTVPYSNVSPWPVAADGTGHSIVLANPTYGEGDPRAWDISDTVGGSPGQMDAFTPSPLRNVVINEFLAHTDPPDYDYIELYNHSTNSVDISGCILTDDAATNKFVIPTGTIISPRGFVFYSETNMNFALNAPGESIFFIKPDGSRILDAVQFAAQQNGVAMGRWPDGANDFYRLQAKTPGTPNAPILTSDVVINELMYDPISGNDDDQYVELYNRSTNTINLGGWQLTGGVTFNFPTNVVIPTNGYVVVARNLTNLFAKYPNLNATNTVGNFSGKLSHNGEYLALMMPAEHKTTDTNGVTVTNIINIAVNDLTYGTGGRWGEWASGGGSSLELIDPNSNNRLAANWADSDETQKSVWTNIECTGVLDNGDNYDSWIDYAQIGLLDVGECLVDNIEVDYNGSNYVSNGTFENSLGLTNWSLQGDMVRSSLENSGYSSGHSLHIRSSDRIWTGDNSCEMALTTNSLASGMTATVRFKARWLHGWPEPLMRLNGNWLEATGTMPVPNNLGTPGMPNSRYVTNAGPAIYNVTHNPPVPAANQNVVVTTQAHDPNGVQNLTLYYRLDPATTYSSVPMKDNGTGGDAIPGDGIFSATIPGHAANQVVAFYISATDSSSVVTLFPAIRAGDNEPVRECVVMFGDGSPGGSFGVYHLWLTQTNVTRWGNLSDLSNESCDGTMVNGNRVIYNMQGRFAGSPYHQGFDYPNGSLCHYKWTFNDDDKFLGATSFNKIHQPGNGPGDDTSLQREQIANSFLRALGVPWLNRRYVAVYVNGNRRGVLMEDAQCPDGDDVKEHFPNDPDGFLYKMQPWFEFGPFPSGDSISFNNNAWCALNPYTTIGGVKKTARYRYNFEIRRTPDSANDFTNVFSLVDAADNPSSPSFVANMENIANMENWMRVFAANHAAGNWDCFGSQNGQNLYGYIGALGSKYSLLMWDFNIVIGNSGSWGPGQNLLTINGADQGMANIYNNPTFMRMYWRAMGELVNGPLKLANSGPLIMAKYNAMTANRLSAENPQANIEPWLTQARTSIASQLAAINARSFSVNTGVTVSNNVAYVTGIAPVNVATVWINGAAYPLMWTSLTGWTVAVPLATGTNKFSVIGVDRNSQFIAGDSNSVSVVYSGTSASPVGQIVINEIMYAPSVANAQFVELYNNSTNTAFDLSGWQFQGLGYTFPSGSVIGPTNYLVLAANSAAFAAAYGATNPVFDIYGGTLSPNGETLTLNNTSNVPVAKVKYSNQLPWPTNANAGGASLQLIDPRQDNWRDGNWLFTTSTATPDKRNSVATSLTPFPSLWINEIQADDLTGITNRAGQHAPWIEIFNPGSNAVSLNGIYLANNYTNLLQWPFPMNASINAGQFEVVFADAQTSLSTTNELHTSFVLTSQTGSLALTRLAGKSQQQVLDYVDYQNVNLNDSYGSYPDGQSFLRQEFFQATPGAPNNGTATQPPSFIAYPAPTAVYSQNFDSLPNPGTVSVNTANPVTINGVVYSLGNPYDFAYPVLSTGNGGLGLSALAGWYGSSAGASKFGATDGDQTTGGQLSFGLPGSSNRALGLLATSTTLGTAFGARFINGGGITLNRMNLQFTGEVWRQSDKPKTLQFYYFVDLTGTNTFITNVTAFIPALNVSFPTVAKAMVGPVDGTSPLNQTSLSVLDQTITNWPPGAALWLVWQMTDSAGSAQGLAVDNLSFSASVPVPVPLNLQIVGTNLIFNWTGIPGQIYQLEYKTNLTDPVWIPQGSPITGNGGMLTTTNDFGASSQRFFHLRLVN